MSHPFRRTLSLFTAAALAVGSALFLSTGIAQAAPPPPVSSAGTEFWLAFDSNVVSFSSHLKLYVSGAPGTTGQVDIVDIGGGVPFNTTFVVPAAGVAEVDIPTEARLSLQTDPVDLAVHVTADSDVTIYGLNRVQYTTDAYLALPVSALGTRYRAIDYRGLSYPSFVSMVATAAGATTVHVEPPAGGGPAFDKVIQQGQVFEWSVDFDVTGTLVTSDNPISVFSGNQCTNIPTGVLACDHIVEQMIPTGAWGKSFITFPLATRLKGDTFRILADVDDTTVSIVKAGGNVTETLDAGEYYELISTEPMAITATEPVLVAQYSNGSEFDGVTSDPFMALIPPYEQGFTSSTFATPTVGFAGNYVNITAPTASIVGVTLDGAAIPTASWMTIPGSDYSGVAIPVTPGFHTIESTVPVLAIVYGFDLFDSYGYPAGLRVARIAEAKTLTLTPPSVTGNVGDSLCTIVTLLDQDGNGVAGARIDMTLSGVVSTPDSIITEADGTVEFCAVSAAEGTTNITATQGTLSATGEFIWVNSYTIETTRTITYTGAGELTPTEVVHTLTWTVTIIGGVTTYTPTDSYPAVPTPVIDGHTVDQDIVHAALHGPTTNVPTHSTVLVTYSKIEIQTGGSALTSGGAMSAPTAAVLLFCVSMFAVCVARLRRV